MTDKLREFKSRTLGSVQLVKTEVLSVAGGDPASGYEESVG